MSEKDAIREKLTWMKVLLPLVTAIDVGLVGWLAGSHEGARRWTVSFAVLAIVSATSAIVYINRRALWLIRRIGELP